MYHLRRMHFLRKLIEKQVLIKKLIGLKYKIVFYNLTIFLIYHSRQRLLNQKQNVIRTEQIFPEYDVMTIVGECIFTKYDVISVLLKE